MSVSVAATSSRHDADADASAGGPPVRDRSAVARVAIATVVAAGLALRTWTSTPMWLDEALTVNISSVGLGDLRGALEQDGAPPLYYVLLAGWMNAFGTSDVAVRLLSALFSAATLPLAFMMGRRRGGAVVGIAALVLLATSPFAIRYATEARMYSLVALLASAGWIALVNVLDDRRPRIGWTIASGAIAGLLLLTHYWSFYLVGATGLALLVTAWRRPDKRPVALRAAGAIGVGSVVLFAPWLPTFLSQMRHTGTPWGVPPGPVEVAFTTLVDFGGGPKPEGQALAAVLAGLAVLALLGRAIDSRRIELDLRTVAGVRADFAVAATALLVGVLVGFATDSAWASRYTSIAFPLVILVAAYGLRSFADRRLVAVVLAVASLLGLAGGARNAVAARRTQAEQVIHAMEQAGAAPGDVVVYCPDQLGPDVHRALPEGFEHYTFPDLADPRLVNWVDYGERMRAADPAAFAAAVLERAKGKNIFYVWMPGYRTLEKSCERVNDALGNARPGNRQLLDPDTDYFERQALWYHPASAP
ncbi:MAG TPA: glycosyltransferase family 39 protein [Acidimicrobiales bacterium]|nr:glycosyltransferase family 39 protein [Acidimicrobiales bacterium]